MVADLTRSEGWARRKCGQYQCVACQRWGFIYQPGQVECPSCLGKRLGKADKLLGYRSLVFWYADETTFRNAYRSSWEETVSKVPNPEDLAA